MSAFSVSVFMLCWISFVWIVTYFVIGPLLLGVFSVMFNAVSSPGSSESFSRGADVQPQLGRTLVMRRSLSPSFFSTILALSL